MRRNLGMNAPPIEKTVWANQQQNVIINSRVGNRTPNRKFANGSGVSSRCTSLDLDTISASWLIELMQAKTGLFDHIIRAGKQRRWNGEAERLCSPEVDNQLKLGGLFDRKVGGLGTLQDLVDVEGGPPLH